MAKKDGSETKDGTISLAIKTIWRRFIFLVYAIEFEFIPVIYTLKP